MELDDGDRLKSIREPGGSCTTSPTVLCTKFIYQDLPDGRSTVKRTYPNGVDMLTTLDAAGRTQQALSSKGASTLRRFDYDYRDTAGRETELVQKAGDFGSGITAGGATLHRLGAGEDHRATERWANSLNLG